MARWPIQPRSLDWSWHEACDPNILRSYAVKLPSGCEPVISSFKLVHCKLRPCIAWHPWPSDKLDSFSLELVPVNSFATPSPHHLPSAKHERCEKVQKEKKVSLGITRDLSHCRDYFPGQGDICIHPLEYDKVLASCTRTWDASKTDVLRLWLWFEYFLLCIYPIFIVSYGMKFLTYH